MTPLRTKTGAPNLSAAILRQREDQDEILYVYGGQLGVENNAPITAETRYPTHTFNQQLLRAALLETAAGSNLDLMTPVAQLLPELACPQTERLVLRDVLAFSSGIQEDNLADLDVLFGYDWNELGKLLRTSEPLFRPGRYFNPVYTDSILIARILEQLHQSPSAELVADLLRRSNNVDIGNMASTEVAVLHQFDLSIKAFRVADLPEWGEFWQPALSGPTFTLPELLRIARACLFNTPDASTSSCWQQLHTPAALTLPTFFAGARADVCPVASGLGFVAYGADSFGPFSYGSLECFTLRVYPERRCAVVVACNWDQPQIRNLALRKIEELLGLGAASPLPQTLPLRCDVDSLLGEFQGRRFSSFHIARDADCLTLTPGDNPCLPKTYTSASIRLRIEGDKLVPVSGLADSCIALFHDHDVNRSYLMKGLNIYAQKRA
jgi:hypothetical protein